MKKLFLALGLISSAATLRAQTGSLTVTTSAAQQSASATAWKITYMSGDMQNAYCTGNTSTFQAPPTGSPVTPSPVGSIANVVTWYPGGWPTGTYLSCFKYNTIYTPRPGIKNFNKCEMTIQRRFYICSNNNEQVTFNLTINADDYFTRASVDGNTVYTNPSSTPGFNITPTIPTQTLTPGYHTLEITCGNMEDPLSNRYYPVYKDSLQWNPFGISIVGTINNANGTLSDADPQNCCSDVCYWKVTGNNILNGNNVFGTLTDDNVRIKTSSVDRGILTNDGKFGWNTTSPTSFLHVNCAGNNPDDGSAGTSDVRFENLEPGRGTVLVVDENGYVFNSGMQPGSSGIRNACTKPNLVPRVINSNGDLDCGSIYDDGTSVGINTASPRTFTGSSLITGGTPPVGTLATLNVNGLTYTNTLVVSSDARFKKNIQTIQDPLTIINKLNGVSYDWNSEAFRDRNFDQLKQAGFIAQDVEKVYPQAVVTDKDGYYALNYNMFIPLLNNGVKSLYDLYQEEKSENEQMRNDIKLLQARLDALNGNNSTTGINTVTATDGSKLLQNAPNPFSNETRIEFYIASMNGNAYIMVYDLNGKELKRMPITVPGKGSVIISGGDLQSGMYIYSLIIDGREIDSKRMTLIK